MLRLAAQLEFVHDFLDVGTESIQIESEVGFELLTVVRGGIDDLLKGEW